MWCCGSKSDVMEPQSMRDYEMARRMQAQENARVGLRAPAALQIGRPRRSSPDWGTGVAGQRLGGDDTASSGLTQEERRRAALEAAERRNQKLPGVAPGKATELARKHQREDYLGRITEQYVRLGEEMPMGLNVASNEQLCKHLQALRERR
eukprot:TRINITY_DN41881_c0_g1_i1.p1 TRINITY_DN41881_c0_g1~~TRINITY_DN41881_c0_g1_i1.p1  ORF type:complete len:151 (+),score=28.91 TRINITY_DN41881_c0_g1_i1:95-547(+)